MVLTAEQIAILEQKKQAALKRRQQLMQERGQLPITNQVVNRTNGPSLSNTFAQQNSIPRTSQPTTNQSRPILPVTPIYMNNRLNSSSSSTTSRSNNNPFNQLKTKSIYDKNYFVTPNKRPGESLDQAIAEKRPNVQAKSPYDVIKNHSITFEIEFKLISNREFYLDFKYSSKLIDAVKKFPSARYDAKNKRWVFKLENYKDICSELKKLKIDRLNLKIKSGIPENVLTILQSTLELDEIKVELTSRIPSDVLEKLFPYQREGIKFGVRREGRLLLADDCGLGKTMQAIGVAIYYFDDWPLLIVCPASVKFQWKAALLKWVPGIDESDIREIDSRKFDPNQHTKQDLVVITSYDSIHKVEPYIKEPKCVILDESHMIKDSSTKRYSLISKLVSKSRRLILISGTPAMSRPVELFTQLKLLMPKVFSNKEKYVNRYCAPKILPWGKVADGCDNLEELKVLLLSTVMVRRMKNDVLNELPAKRRVKVNLDCHLTSKDKSEIEKFVGRFKGPQNINDENESFSAAYLKTAEIKLSPIKNYLELVIERGTKFLFFAHHKNMIEGICDFLGSKNTTYIRIDGSTPTSERSKCCEFFQNNPQCKAAVLSITAAGVGLNLTAAQLVLFGELYYTPGALTQAEDRVHRIGQKDSVYIEYLIAPGTVDDHIWNMVHRKIETLDALGIKGDGFSFKKDNPVEEEKK